MASSTPRSPTRRVRGRPSSVEVRDALLREPLRRNLDFDATDADRAPHRLAFLTCDVLVVLREVERHHVGAAFETLHRAAHEKNLSYPLTNAMHTMYRSEERRVGKEWRTRRSTDR